MQHEKFDMYTRRCKRCEECFKTIYKRSTICLNCNANKKRGYNIPTTIYKGHEVLMWWSH